MVKLQNVLFEYGKGKPLFSGLNLTLEPGNIYGLLGKNGAGKTTLLKIIAGLRYATDGNCQVLGYDPKKRLPSMLQDIFFIPEAPVVPKMSIKEYTYYYASFYPGFDHSAHAKYLAELGIDPTELFHKLSHGQQKKAMLSFAFATNCRLLILDEPTNGLDIPSKAQVRKLLASLSAENRTIIISTHQVRDLENIIDPIVILDNGRVIFNHSMAEISQRLTMQIAAAQPDPVSAIYSEKTVGGYAVISANTTGVENAIDIEVLFNAVTAFPREIENIFAKVRQ